MSSTAYVKELEANLAALTKVNANLTKKNIELYTKNSQYSVYLGTYGESFRRAEYWKAECVRLEGELAQLKLKTDRQDGYISILEEYRNSKNAQLLEVNNENAALSQRVLKIEFPDHMAENSVEPPLKKTRLQMRPPASVSQSLTDRNSAMSCQMFQKHGHCVDGDKCNFHHERHQQN